MKTVYLVWYNWYEHHYGQLKEGRNLEGIFENIEDAKSYISRRPCCRSDYEIEEFYDYYKSSQKS